MRDAEAKIWLLDTFTKFLSQNNLVATIESRPTCTSDLALLSRGVRVCIEYENSSRGMVSHVCKHFKQAKELHSLERRLVVFVRTENHISKHRADYINSMAVAESLKSEWFGVLAYSEQEFLGVGLSTLKNLLAVNKVLLDET